MIKSDIFVIASLTLCYAAWGGLQNCLGLYQETWKKHLELSATQASWVTGLTISFIRFPSPVTEFIRDWFKIPPFVLMIIVTILIGCGLLIISVVTSLEQLMAASVCGIGFGTSWALLGIYTSIYHFFQDSDIPLVTSILSAGSGLGTIVIALSFKWMEPAVGWRNISRYHSLIALPFMFAAIVLFPRVSRELKIKTKDQKACESLPESPEDSVTELKESEKSKVTNSKACIVKELSNDVSLNKKDSTSRFVKRMQAWAKILRNVKFFLLIVSWLLVSGSFKAILVHEPQRIVQLGYSVENSAESLAINGAVQFASRLTVGLLASADFISIIRLSQIAKFVLALSTLISVYCTSLSLQHVYMLMIGICGGIINTTDVILVKDCCRSGREIAISMFLFSDALSALIATTSAGYFVDFFHGYEQVFMLYAANFVLGSLLTVLLEICIKRTKPEKINEDISVL